MTPDRARKCRQRRGVYRQPSRSTFRRCATSSEPLCSAIAKPSSFMLTDPGTNISAGLAGVDESQRGLVSLDQDRVQRVVLYGRPRQPFACIKHLHDGGRGAAARTISAASLSPPRCGTRKRAACSPAPRRWPTVRSNARPVPVPTTGQTGASLCFHVTERMQLIEHDPSQRGEQECRRHDIQQRQLLGRCQQDVRRVTTLTLLLRHRRVAGVVFYLDGHF